MESCSGPDAAESLAFAAFGDHGTREFFTHVRFHKHEEDRIVIHMLVELYARSSDEATDVMSDAARGELTITSLAEESRPPASSPARRTSAPTRRDAARPPARRSPRSERPSSPQHLGGVLARGAAAGSGRSCVAPQIGEATSSSAPAVGWSTVYGRRAAGRGGRGERVRHRAHLARGHAGGVEIAQPVLGGALAEALLEQRHELLSVLDAVGVRREARRPPASSSRPITEQSARNRPSFAAATAIRPDEVSKSW